MKADEKPVEVASPPDVLPPEPEAKPAPEDIAARDYMRLLPKFENAVKQENLSRRALENVFIALMRFPFESTPDQWSYPGQAVLFNLGLQILDCKHAMLSTFANMKAEQLKEMADEATQGSDHG